MQKRVTLCKLVAETARAIRCFTPKVVPHASVKPTYLPKGMIPPAMLYYGRRFPSENRKAQLGAGKFQVALGIT